jgi:hypothetical protein
MFKHKISKVLNQSFQLLFYLLLSRGAMLSGDDFWTEEKLGGWGVIGVVLVLVVRDNGVSLVVEGFIILEYEIVIAINDIKWIKALFLTF